MQELEESIGEIAEALMNLPREELRRLERSTQQLTREQRDFVRFTLESALLENRLPTYQITLFEYFFESWWEHSLATKLAVIDCVVELSTGGVWPGDTLLRCGMADTCGGKRETAA